MTIIIQDGTGAGIYDVTVDPRLLLDAVAVVINADPDKRKVTQGPLAYLREDNVYRFATLKHLAEYMFGWIDAPERNVPPTLDWPQGEHEMKHFLANPTANKTAWDLSYGAAKALCDAQINKYVTGIMRNSRAWMFRANGWCSWYVSGIHNANVGRYQRAGERNGVATDGFAMQAQYNMMENHISYHGYPDEQVRKEGASRVVNVLHGTRGWCVDTASPDTIDPDLVATRERVGALTLSALDLS